MTKSTITRERAEQLANFKGAPVTRQEEQELARIALAAMDSEPVEPIWGAKKYPVSRPVPGAKLIIWDETGKFVGYGSAVVMHESGVAIQLSDGRRLDSNHELRWQYALQPAPVVPAAYVRDDRGAMMLNGKCEPRIGFGEGWNACRAAMLQTANKLGNSPVIPDGLIAAVNRLLDSDGSRGCYSAIQCGDAHDEIERLLAAAPQEVKTERKK